MLNIYQLALLLPLVLLVIYWWRSSEQHSVALKGARDYCRERKLQLLDETLVFRRFALEKDARGKRRLCKIYEFDYSLAGEDRDCGEIVLTGHSILRIILPRETLEITEYRQ